MQIYWCLILIGIAGFFWRGDQVNVAVGFFAGGVLYAALSLAAFRGNRWATHLSLLLPVLILLVIGPNVIYNLYAFLTDHSRYLDSPGTILVVGVEMLIFIIPAITTLIMDFSHENRNYNFISFLVCFLRKFNVNIT
ncbi:MAG: hypothetical protein WAT67_08290 [Candidatus Contendobacter sp.]